MMRISLAKRLRVLRVERGLTLRQAAERAGVRAGTLSGIERGEHVARDATLGKIARAYGVPVEDLLEEPALTSAAPGKVEAPQTGLDELEDLAHTARSLKAEWASLAQYERVTKLSAYEYRQTLARLEEIERQLAEVKERWEELDPPLCTIHYRLDEPAQVEFYRAPTAEEEANLRKKLGAYEVVDTDVFSLVG